MKTHQPEADCEICGAVEELFGDHRPFHGYLTCYECRCNRQEEIAERRRVEDDAAREERERDAQRKRMGDAINAIEATRSELTSER